MKKSLASDGSYPLGRDLYVIACRHIKIPDVALQSWQQDLSEMTRQQWQKTAELLQEYSIRPESLPPLE